jgi:hypothetical protein
MASSQTAMSCLCTGRHASGRSGAYVGRPQRASDPEAGRRSLAEREEERAAGAREDRRRLVGHVASTVGSPTPARSTCTPSTRRSTSTTRAARELWKFCWATGSGSHVEFIAHLIDEQPADDRPPDWWEHGAQSPATNPTRRRRQPRSVSRPPSKQRDCARTADFQSLSVTGKRSSLSS